MGTAPTPGPTTHEVGSVWAQIPLQESKPYAKGPGSAQVRLSPCKQRG